MRAPSLLLPAVLATALAACSADGISDDGQFASNLPPPDVVGARMAEQREYRIGPLDKVSVSVFQMKDFNLEKAQVDSAGRLVMPMIGRIEAQGRTAEELSEQIAAKLGECCLQNPQVNVQVDEAISQQITVTGAVVESNVYTLRRRTTLIDAISMARGPDRLSANLKRVAVYRNVNGQRVGALFNVEAIREGKAQDPEVFGGDTIIVDSSSARAAWRDVISAIPFFGVFTAF